MFLSPDQDMDTEVDHMIKIDKQYRGPPPS